MAACAFMLDVMIGDLCLTNPPAIAHRTKDPLCPIVAIQVHDGPLLYVPFLSPESVQSHLRDVDSGHDFLPMEVEESYLNGGKFVFRRGRSCLFTSQNADTKESGGKVTLLAVGRYISIMVINGLCFPPSMFGRCKVAVPICGSESREPSRSLTGKVILNDQSKKSVASLQISITLRSLGEDISRHAEHFGNPIGEQKQTIPGSVPTPKLSNDFTFQTEDLRRDRYETFINLLHGRPSQSQVFADHVHVVTEPTSERSQGLKNASTNFVSQNIPKASDLISMKIAELERNPHSETMNSLGNVMNPRLEEKVQKQSQVYYTIKEMEADRFWNGKISEVEGYSLEFEESFSGSDESESMPKSEMIEEMKKEQKVSKDLLVKVSKISKEKHRKTRKHFRDVAVATSPKKKAKHVEGIKKPTGWLRSTPLAPYRIHNVPPRPKLTRATLLHRAKLDPELAKQLHAEVDFQVKQKLKILDEAFKEEMCNLRRKKLMRSARKKTAASSQTEEEKDEADLLDDVKPGSVREDFSQQTEQYHQKSHKFTQMGESFIKEVDESPRLQLIESKQSHTTTTKGRRGLRRGETYDIDVTDRMANTFTVNDDIAQSFIEKENLAASTMVKKSKKESSSPKESHRHRKMSDHSQSISESEPKQRRRGSSSTNRIRDSKIKPPESTYDVTSRVNKSNSESLLDDTSVEERLVGSSSSKGSSSGVTKPRKRGGSYVSSLGNRDSEPSEVSEASNLSVEVYQEILKGKKADLLMSNGSRNSRLQEVATDSSAVEEAPTADDDSAGNESQRNDRQVNILQKMIQARGKKLINSRTYSIKEGQGLDASFNIPVIHGSSSSETDAVVRAGIQESRSHLQSRPVHSSRVRKDSIDIGRRIQSAKATPSPRLDESEEEEEDEEGTVTDISARIAALLLPKNVEVASMHTDSISSYMPSDVEGTLSSLSDMS